jgi:hypothetical protein
MNRNTTESQYNESEHGGVPIGGGGQSSYRDPTESNYSRGSENRIKDSNANYNDNTSNRSQNHSQHSGYPVSQPRLNNINESEDEYRRSSNIREESVPMQNKSSIKMDEVVR